MKRVFVLDRNSNDQAHPLWRNVRMHGFDVHVGDIRTAPWTPDIVISMGVTLMEITERTMDQFPNAALFCYNWDVYEWVWTNPRENEYDYARYGKLLARARRIWTPSHCTSIRTKQWYGLDNCTRVLSACPYWEHDNIRDDGYVLNCLRPIPDPWWGVLEDTCARLGIPCKTTLHALDKTEYRDAIAGCRFIVAPLYELSTGGLSLMEAYYHGKPVLINASPWNGGRDYFGDRAEYFTDNLAEKLHAMYYNPRTVYDGRSYIRINFSDSRMADDMVRSMRQCLSL